MHFLPDPEPIYFPQSHYNASNRPFRHRHVSSYAPEPAITRPMHIASTPATIPEMGLIQTKRYRSRIFSSFFPGNYVLHHGLKFTGYVGRRHCFSHHRIIQERKRRAGRRTTSGRGGCRTRPAPITDHTKTASYPSVIRQSFLGKSRIFIIG